MSATIIELQFGKRSEIAAEPAGGGAEVRKLPYSVTRRAHARKPRCSENGTPEERAKMKRRYTMSPEELAAHDRDRGASMHTVVFRSTKLILASSPDELAHDVGLDLDKAQTKLRRIREQMVRDRENAAARDTMMNLVEAKLAAAVDAVQSE
jgi:hypothetical protein